MSCQWEYDILKELVKDETLPAMLVNLDCLDENISRISKLVSGFDKKIRIASKSIRVPRLLKYVIEKGGPAFQGIMCYSISEAALLHDQGFDDFLVAYPTVDNNEIELFFSLTQKGVKIILMCDHWAQLEKNRKILGRKR